MLDTDFNDFLDSDDDEFFVKASNSFLDCEKTSTELCPGSEKNISHIHEKNIYSDYSELGESPSLLESPSSVINLDNKIPPSNIQNNSNNTTEVVPTTPVSSEICKSTSTVNKHSFTPDNPSYIDNRFTPGFTPKVKKRKFAGPAGLLECIEESNEENPVPCGSNKVPALDIEFENIASSQFSPELLSLTSWQKLQSAVSSSSNLHSTAKYYSIQRVLNESSKKKLPKHMVVPILCVLLKKISSKASVVSVFMDDTGEINGKIDADVLSMYKEFITEGAALILKNVTFLCNVLILKVQNIVSMYMPDGTIKHVQNLESILETSEPLKPINCECLKMPQQNMKSNISVFPNHHKVGCLTQGKSRCSSFSNQRNAVNKNMIVSTTSKSVSNLPVSKNIPNPVVNSTSNYAVNTVNRNLSSAVVNKNISNSTSIPAVHKGSIEATSMRSDAFLESLLSDDDCMDEFDELLGNLDEKSFLEGV